MTLLRQLVYLQTDPDTVASISLELIGKFYSEYWELLPCFSARKFMASPVKAEADLYNYKHTSSASFDIEFRMNFSHRMKQEEKFSLEVQRKYLLHFVYHVIKT